MSQIDALLTLARGELGTKENPAGSNNVKYNTAYYGREVNDSAYSWCVVFQWWLFQKAGLASLFYGGMQTASCGTLADYAKAHGLWIEGDYRAGDLVFFHFDGAVIQHIGIVESVQDDGALVTIEGNTGTTSEANGGEVQRRIRPCKYVAGGYRPQYDTVPDANFTQQGEEDDEVTQPQFDAMMNAYLKNLETQDPSEYSADARAWAEGNGLIKGDAQGNLQYKSFCTREQIMVFLQRLMRQLEK